MWIWNLVMDWFFSGQDGECPVDLMTEKVDGWSLVITDQDRLFTKNGCELLCSTPGVFGQLARVYRRKFAHVRPQAIRHKRHGRAVALFAELAILRTDEVDANSECGCDLEDLSMMMRKKNLEDAPFVLRCFYCSFAKDDPALPKKQRSGLSLAERIDLCMEAFGEDYVVRVLIDARKPITKHIMDVAYECYAYKEGVVVSQKGVVRKDKPPRPVDMLLAAVGLSIVDGVRLPTHFFWAVEDNGVYYVPLVDDRRFLFEAGRGKKGKVQLTTGLFSVQEGQFRCAGGNFQADAYIGLLKMMGTEFVTASSVTEREAILANGRRLQIRPNRRIAFTDPAIVELRFLAEFQRGVIGCNQLWVTGTPPYHVGAVHFQAPQFLAGGDFGYAIYSELFFNDEPTPADKIVWLAAKASRDIQVHAEAVYGPDPPNLVYGRLCEISSPERGAYFPLTPEREEE